MKDDFPNFPKSKPSPNGNLKKKPKLKNYKGWEEISAMVILLVISIFLRFSDPEKTNIECLVDHWPFYVATIISTVFIVKSRNG